MICLDVLDACSQLGSKLGPYLCLDSSARNREYSLKECTLEHWTEFQEARTFSFSLLFDGENTLQDDELSIESEGGGGCTDLLILVLFYQDQRVPVYNDVSWLTIILQHLCVKHEIY